MLSGMVATRERNDTGDDARSARVRPARFRLTRFGLSDVVVLLLAAVAVTGLLLRRWTPTTWWGLGLVAGSPYLLLAAPLGVLIAVLRRRRVVALIAVVATVLGVVTQARLYTSDDVTGARVRTLSVMTLNLRLGEADPAAVVAAVRRDDVDVLMLQELTTQEQAALQKAGLDRLLPHHVSRPRVAAEGTGLWSRFPLRDARALPQLTFATVAARVMVPGVALPPTMVALHLAGPVPDTAEWRQDVTTLPSVLDPLPADAPVIVGGDFNATPDNIRFRALLSGGYQDAADQAGAGMTRTYPAGRWYPPLLAIDHVLTRDASATGAATISITGSDHRGLLVTAALPRT